MNNFKEENDRAGKRVIIIARCSTPQQAEFSIDRQIAQIIEFCIVMGMTVVGEERLEGVSGLDPSARSDIDRVIDRKRTANDFDAIILADVDRFTRAGIEHAFHLKYILRVEGIEVEFARHDIPRGQWGWIAFAMKSVEANSDVKGITKRLVEGYVKAMLEGRVTYSRCAPFGCDKLVSTAEGQPIHRVRKDIDGNVTLLSPNGETVLRKLGRTKKFEQPHEYKTTPNDVMTIIPGDPARVAIVQEIYRLRYTHPIHRDARIARVLNDRGVPSAKGRRWNRSSVQNLLHNPIFFGIGVANLSTAAELHMPGKTVTAMTPPPQSRTGRKGQQLVYVKRKWRSPDDWHLIRYSAMEEFIPCLSIEERSKALASQLDWLSRYAERNRSGCAPELNEAGRKSGGVRHNGCSYFLNGLLKCPIDNSKYYPKSKSKTGRSYVHLGRTSVPSSDRPVLNVPANFIENEILRLMGVAIRAMPDLRQKIIDRVASSDPAMGEIDVHSEARLRRVEADLLREIGATMRVNGDLSDAQLAILTDPLKRQVRDTAAKLAQIDRIKAAKGSLSSDASGVADRVMARLDAMLSIGGERTDAENAHIASIARVLIQRLTVHPDTYVVEVEIGIPSWIGTSLSVDDVLVSTPRPSSGHHEPAFWINLGRFSGRMTHSVTQKRRRWLPFELSACS